MVLNPHAKDVPFLERFKIAVRIFFCVLRGEPVLANAIVGSYIYDEQGVWIPVMVGVVMARPSALPAEPQQNQITKEVARA